MRWKRWVKIFLATGAYSGYVPFAPGTAGAIVGALGVWWLRDASTWVHVLIALAITGVGVWVSQEAKELLGSKDPSQLVIDEVAGIWISMIGVPVTLQSLLLGFLFFRIFDIFKVPPGNIFDKRIKNGWGVMMDDVTAGIYSNLLLRLILRAKI